MIKTKRILVPVLILIFLVGGVIIKFSNEKVAVERNLSFSEADNIVDNNEKITIDIATVKEAIAPASKMISYEYFYTDAGSYEKSHTLINIPIPFTTDKTVYTYSGSIGAGIQFDKINYELDDGSRVIYVYLPEPEILSHELDHDSFRYYDIKSSIFTSSDIGDYEELRHELMTYEEEKLLENKDFWKNVKAYTETNIKNIMTGSGLIDDYKVVCDWQ